LARGHGAIISDEAAFAVFDPIHPWRCDFAPVFCAVGPA